MQQDVSATKPNGPVAAAFIATGIGSLVLGILIVLNEINEGINSFLRFDDSFGLGAGVGPLSGKAILASLAFVVAWLILHFLMRGKEYAWNKVMIASLVLVGLGFALTFPPIFEAVVHLFPAAE